MKKNIINLSLVVLLFSSCANPSSSSVSTNEYSVSSIVASSSTSSEEFSSFISENETSSTISTSSSQLSSLSEKQHYFIWDFSSEYTLSQMKFSANNLLYTMTFEKALVRLDDYRDEYGVCIFDLRDERFECRNMVITNIGEYVNGYRLNYFYRADIYNKDYNEKIIYDPDPVEQTVNGPAKTDLMVFCYAYALPRKEIAQYLWVKKDISRIPECIYYDVFSNDKIISRIIITEDTSDYKMYDYDFFLKTHLTIY